MLKVLLKVNMCSKWYYTLSIFKEILILSHFLRVLLLIIYIKQPCQGWGRGFDPRLALLLCKKTDFQRWKSVFALHPKVYHILLFIDRLADLVCKRNEVVIVIDSFVADHDMLQCGERLRRD